ncbi:hypothetical protein ONS95_001891 [Cadophora gregata]|uniref:uncharacterized protein n=1 Tax=Cadophora gregata TaxID=51156 RepID=UPI0026DDA0B1|nr:uncharacterized protein ONS95_001891 [Cadophora gregata]KAK0111538.1 hypothetical protein ONS95_001891 [Cadophora gregata]
MAATSRTQYQHFVPQFLLRNFSHPYKPVKKDPKKQQHSKLKGEKRMYRGDRVVNTIDLSSQTPTPCEARVDRIFGQMDMYRDSNKPSAEQQEIEKMFSRMEGQASIAFRKITKAFEGKEEVLWLARHERDLIRKFLFLLKYRGSTFHQRFYHEITEDCESDDRELLWEYMKDKGFKRPMDVWFNNLKIIMELNMDPEKAWIKELPKQMYTEDAMWFISHVQGMYMAICTPSNPIDEFILTDNCYNVFEGPNSFVIDKTSGRLEPAYYAPLHEFAPISPKLMIVLRSFLLPVPEEDVNPVIKAERNLWNLGVLDCVYKEEVKSLLSDLPITKAQNNYSGMVDGRLVLNSDEDGTSRKNHRFCFKYFPLDTKHVHTISAILLQNSYTCSRIVFGTNESLLRTLDAHLTSPWNTMMGDDASVRIEFLRRLGAVAKLLGSEKEPIWTEPSDPEVRDNEGARLKILEQRRLYYQTINKDDLDPKPDTDNEFLQLYYRLGGSDHTLFKDVEQAGLMWKLRIKIDSWSQGVDESIRQRNRLILTDIYLSFPPRRVWLYGKQVRFAHLETTEELENLADNGNFIREPEDIIAQASQIIRPQCLSQLMYKATMNDIWMKERSEVDLWAKVIKMDEHARAQFTLLKRLNGCHPQSIRDCGKLYMEFLSRSAGA